MPQDQTNQKIDDIFSGLEVDQTPSVSSPEKPVLPEFKPEKTEVKPVRAKEAEKAEVKPGEEVKAGLEQSPVVTGAQAVAPAAATSPIFLKVEKVLEEDLSEAYFKMTLQKQAEFKKKGEETALKVSQLLQATKVKIKQIFKLIIGWLNLIPGINKHFLEQEAKIKTDKLLEIREEELMK